MPKNFCIAIIQYIIALRLVSRRKLITVAGATDLMPLAVQGLSVTKAVSRENFNTGPIMMNY